MKPATDTNRDEKLSRQPKHTQGEWIVSGNQIMILGKTKSIATVHVCKNFDAGKWKNVYDIEAEANAQRIVKAVNMYDKFIEGLKEISEGKGRYAIDRLSHATNTIEDMKAIADNLLKQAEQE